VSTIVNLNLTPRSSISTVDASILTVLLVVCDDDDDDDDFSG